MKLPLTLLATATRTFFEVPRLHVMDQWWHWLVLGAVCSLVVAIVVYMYRRDSVELPRLKRWLLLILRVLAFAGLLVFFFKVEKRSEQGILKNSRLILLVDTSLSMALADVPEVTDAATSRFRQIVSTLATGQWLESLRKKHDVVVYRFDEDAQPTEVALLAKTASAMSRTSANTDRSLIEQSLREARALVMLGVLFLAAAAVCLVIHGVMMSMVAQRESWALLLATLALIFGTVTLCISNVRNPNVSISLLLGKTSLDDVSVSANDPSPSADDAAAPENTAERIDWQNELAPRGTRTRLGDAVSFILDQERGGPIAGVVLLSDGGVNAGNAPARAIQLARDANIPIFTVGLGSEKRPINVRIADLEAPERVYPGDAFTLTGYVQATGLEGRTARVELVSAAQDGDNVAADGRQFEDELRIELARDGVIVPVEFELTPTEEGQRIYTMSVIPSGADQDPNDNQQSAKVRIVERKNRVLMVAGGPTREFRFLRNLLFRDSQVELDVWLQTSRAGSSQEADRLLTDFPTESRELFEYDCIVAFDPDWSRLDELQMQLLDRWVAEQAGGLIVVAGPIFTEKWSGRSRDDARFDIIRGLYPVTFYSRASAALGGSNVGSERAWPLQFSEDGGARFLWLGDTALQSEQTWSEFDGVYGYYTLRGAKAGATVHARFSDPQTAVDGQLPIYLAEQFYGSGRVFYLGSGEMWRLRELDERYFEEFYTKLIRHVSQGRLLRDSSRGILLVDKDRCLLGDTVVVRASLTDPQFRPLTLPELSADVITPDGRLQRIVLRQVKQAAREGMYAGQITATAEGDYQILVALDGATGDEVLTRGFRARVPDLEMEKPERNDALLGEMANRTGGRYYVGMNAALGQRGIPGIETTVVPGDQQMYLPGSPDREHEQRLMTWLMGLMAGVLSMEWLLRRLNRLA